MQFQSSFGAFSAHFSKENQINDNNNKKKGVKIKMEMTNRVHLTIRRAGNGAGGGEIPA